MPVRLVPGVAFWFIDDSFSFPRDGACGLPPGLCRERQFSPRHPDVTGRHGVGWRSVGVHMAPILLRLLRLLTAIDKLGPSGTQGDLGAEDIADERAVAFIPDGRRTGLLQDLGR